MPSIDPVSADVWQAGKDAALGEASVGGPRCGEATIVGLQDILTPGIKK